MKFDEKSLDRLRRAVSERLSGKRLNHTLEVEKMAARLGELYMPERVDILRAAALLHDVTKEYSFEKQLQICHDFGIIISKQDMLKPKTIHAKTAALIIPSEFPEFADDEVVSAVRWHTSGRADMRIAEKLIFLADYIDESRTYEECVALRRAFWDAEPQAMSDEEREEHLDRILLKAFDTTIEELIGYGAPIGMDTIEARNWLIVAHNWVNL